MIIINIEYLTFGNSVIEKMITTIKILPLITLFVGGWMVLNGILHDIFVMRSEHGKIYNRELLRLLMDGHILMTCGLMQMICFFGLRNNELWAYYVAGISCISLLVYCSLIFPFLKSFGTMTMNIILLILLVIEYIS
jgi:hypothetical protein